MSPRDVGAESSNMSVNLRTLGCASINTVAVFVTNSPTVEVAATVNHCYKGAYTTESYEVEWALCGSFRRNLKLKFSSRKMRQTEKRKGPTVTACKRIEVTTANTIMQKYIT